MTAEHDLTEPQGGRLTFSVDTDSSRILLRGELDEDTAALLACVVDREVARARTDLCLDLAELAFFDLRGFAAVCSARAAVQATGGRLRITNASDLFRTGAAWWGVPELVDDRASAAGPV